MKLQILIFSLAAIIYFGSCNKDEDFKDTISNSSELPDVSDYPIISTEQMKFYDNSIEISNPGTGNAFYGQNANYPGNRTNYKDNEDGTVTDLVSGLMWQQNPGNKMTYSEALTAVNSFNLAGYTDWRLPTIKELYSLILFNGMDPSGYNGTSTSGLIPFIDTDYFNFEYGDLTIGERIIDAQYASSTIYVDYTMFGDETLFGVNFADGRIKGYGLTLFGQDKTFFVKYVRGNTNYGINNFVDNGDGTISDLATALMWLKDDSQSEMNWEESLSYAENLNASGYSDWRLPDAKELQSIVEYTLSPASSNSAAIDPIFNCTSISNEAGQNDFPFYWTGTTHTNWTSVAGGNAAYISFGRAMGYMNQWVDVHGAGAQRSDPKTGNPDDYPTGHGPQGDAIRINNFVRCVRSLK